MVALSTLALISVVVLLETFATYHLQQAVVVKNRMPYLFAGLLLYTTIGYMYYTTLWTGRVGIVNAIWSGATVVTTALLGYYVFGQMISTREIIGIIVTIIGILILTI